MEYKQFTIDAFQQGPAKWRASVRRTNGRPLTATARARMLQFTTADAASAEIAIIMAMEAIDLGAFTRATARSTEKFWRPRGEHRRPRRQETTG
jgi:hypothetical protein